MDYLNVSYMAMELVGRHCSKWGLPFYYESQMLYLGKRIERISASYTLEKMILDKVEHIEYLGMRNTTDLKQNTHVRSVCTKANTSLTSLDI